MIILRESKLKSAIIDACQKYISDIHTGCVQLKPPCATRTRVNIILKSVGLYYFVHKQIYITTRVQV